MKQTINVLLVFAVVIPLVLLFWPFAAWGGAMALILRLIPALAAQTLLCRVGKYRLVKAIPLLLTLAAALWGTYLYFTSPHWAGATARDLLADYVSPFAGCAVAAILWVVWKNEKRK